MPTPTSPGSAPEKPRPLSVARWLLPGGDPARLFVILMIVTCFFGLKGRFINPDSAGYYMFILSPFLDGDLDYTNDLDRLQVQPIHRKNNFRPSASGLPMNPFAIGAPMLLAPFFLLAHLLAIPLRAMGWMTHPLWYWDLNGIYYLTLVVGNALLATVTMYLLYRILLRLVSPEASLWTVLLCWFASPLPAYIYLYGNHSHLASAFTSTLAVGLWLASGERKEPKDYLVFGAVCGLCALVRWQDALILGLVLLPLKRPDRYLRCLVMSAIGFWSLFSLQLAEWLYIHHTIFVQPPAQGFMRWLDPQILGLLLSARMGLFTWHPMFLISIVGLRHLGKRSWVLVAGVLLMLGAQTYINACVPDWWGGNSFGKRRMMGLLPLLALPIAVFFEGTARAGSRARKFAWAMAAALVAFNFLLFFQYYRQDIFFSSGRFSYPEILANQWRVVTATSSLILPFLQETLWAQLAGLSSAGKVLTLAAWAGILALGVAGFRCLLDRQYFPLPIGDRTRHGVSCQRQSPRVASSRD